MEVWIINPLEEKHRKFVFVGDELDDQAFIYHHKMYQHNRLCLGDGSAK